MIGLTTTHQDAFVSQMNTSHFLNTYKPFIRFSYNPNRCPGAAQVQSLVFVDVRLVKWLSLMGHFGSTDKILLLRLQILIHVGVISTHSGASCPLRSSQSLFILVAIYQRTAVLAIISLYCIVIILNSGTLIKHSGKPPFPS